MMANESILVVDDVPVNLKLTDLLLRREGFKVHTAPDAEQALSLLRGFQPDLMLVDIELPGMDGLALTRKIRQNQATRNMVVIALSGHAAGGFDRKALEAGCDGYITKPVDSATLVSSIRDHLKRHGARPKPLVPSPHNPPVAEDDADLETLQRRFLEEGSLQSQQMLESLHQNFDAAKSARLCHQWVGAAGILGYLGISECARRAEEALSAPAPDTWRLRELLSDLVLSFSGPHETSAQVSVSSSVSEAVAGKPIALVGFGTEEAESLCGVLEMAGARPRVFRAAEAPGSQPVGDCSAVMLAVSPETARTPWMAPDGLTPMKKPLVLAGKREQIMALDAALQSRASEFLIDGWQPEEALMRLSFALAREPRPNRTGANTAPAPVSEYRPVSGTPKIVVADDDATVRSLVRLTLQDYGMECLMASSGPEALQMIRDQGPHAALLDVNMPGMDGYLVLAALREEKLPVRVVLLTARRHENDISRGFTLGADDYVVKPFNSVELVARLKRLFRR